MQRVEFWCRRAQSAAHGKELKGAVKPTIYSLAQIATASSKELFGPQARRQQSLDGAEALSAGLGWGNAKARCDDP